MKRIITAAMLFSVMTASWSQQTVTLWQCYDSAAIANPLSGERELYRQMTILRDQNLASARMPSLDLGGTLAWQSDVVDMSELLSSIPVPPGSLPSIPHEQYRATLDVSQVIWDGGVTRSARAVEQVVSELNMQQNEADIYRLREQVNNYFFPLLLARSQLEVTGLLVAELDARISEASSGVENGVVPPVTLDVLRAEKIRAEQVVSELNRRCEALVSALGQITGIEGLEDAELLLPEPVINGDEAIDNPELRLFDVRQRQLEMSKGLLKSQRMPKAFGFAQAGYGSPPGNNFLSENPDFYYSLGAGIKWNIFDWNKTSNERKSLALQQQLLGIKKSAAKESLQRMLTVRLSEIKALREAADRDDELIELRRKISGVAASQLNNGTITASQYLAELNSEKQAVIAAEARRISIARAEVDYIYITGHNK
ncbi:MAG: TolC family protein [Bacteroidales bacterium]|nr:TolC family protein [Bacteroidales bacterium]